MRSKKMMEAAKQTIYEQEGSLAIKRSAWTLFRHELTRQNPGTHKPYTRRKALANTLKWMSEQRTRQEAKLKQLSPMQKKIIEMLVLHGLTQKQIAYQLKRDPDTIKHHCERIRRKVGASSMYQVVAIAVDLGWVTAPSVKETKQ